MSQDDAGRMRIIAAGDNLTPEEVIALRDAPQAVKMADLYVISKAESQQRKLICKSLSEGKAKNAAAALKMVKAKGVQHTIVELRYCTATPAAGEVARFNVQTRGIDVGQLMTNATSGSTADVEPSEVAYQLSSTAKAEWDAGDVNQGLIIVDIERAANKAADTLNQDVFLTGIRIYQVFERYDTEGTQVYW